MRNPVKSGHAFQDAGNPDRPHIHGLESEVACQAHDPVLGRLVIARHQHRDRASSALGIENDVKSHGIERLHHPRVRHGGLHHLPGRLATHILRKPFGPLLHRIARIDHQLAGQMRPQSFHHVGRSRIRNRQKNDFTFRGGPFLRLCAGLPGRAGQQIGDALLPRGPRAVNDGVAEFGHARPYGPAHHAGADHRNRLGANGRKHGNRRDQQNGKYPLLHQ